MTHVHCAIDRLRHGPPCRVLVVSAHPDDEIIGLGATLAALDRNGVDLEILHVTDGAPRNPELRPALRDLTPAEAAARRREEVRAALRAGGIDASVVAESLAVADQEGAEAMAWIARALARRLAATPFDVVVTHPFEGCHPDHDATAFAVASAIALLQRQGRPWPLHAEMSSYFLDGKDLRTATFLESPPPPCPPALGLLSEAERALRRSMLAPLASERDVIAQLRIDAEPLRCAPSYEFTRPPHAGPLDYERFAFGWSWSRWQALAIAALADLGSAPTPNRSSRLQRSTAPKRYL